MPRLSIHDTNAASLAVQYNDLGIACFEYDPAKDQRHFRTTIRLDRTCALAHNNLGLALIETDDLPQAQKSISEKL